VKYVTSVPLVYEKRHEVAHRRPRRPIGFGATQAFAPQLIVRISPLEAQAVLVASIPPDQD
jgi:hypothetical protein